MAFDGSGNFIRTDGTRTGATVWSQARDANVLVNAPDADTHDEDFATGLENCLTRDGQNSPSANLPMNAKKHTGVADATANSEYAAYGQLLALVQPFVGRVRRGWNCNRDYPGTYTVDHQLHDGKGVRFHNRDCGNRIYDNRRLGAFSGVAKAIRWDRR